MTASAREQSPSGPPYGPTTRGVYLCRDKTGAPQISVTAARKRKRGGGRRLKTLKGQDRNIAYPYLSAILHYHTGKRFAFDADGLRDEYHPISEDMAIQMMLLMEAVKSEPNYARARDLAQAIAAMTTCEAAWWRAQHNLKQRPRRVMRALALMYA